MVQPRSLINVLCPPIIVPDLHQPFRCFCVSHFVEAGATCKKIYSRQVRRGLELLRCISRGAEEWRARCACFVRGRGMEQACTVVWRDVLFVVTLLCFREGNESSTVESRLRSVGRRNQSIRRGPTREAKAEFSSRQQKCKPRTVSGEGGRRAWYVIADPS